MILTTKKLVPPNFIPIYLVVAYFFFNILSNGKINLDQMKKKTYDHFFIFPTKKKKIASILTAVDRGPD